MGRLIMLLHVYVHAGIFFYVLFGNSVSDKPELDSFSTFSGLVRIIRGVLGVPTHPSSSGQLTEELLGAGLMQFLFCQFL